MSCFDDHVMLYHILVRFEFQFSYLLHLFISVAWPAWHIPIQRCINLRITKIYLEKPFRNYRIPKTKDLSMIPLPIEFDVIVSTFVKTLTLMLICIWNKLRVPIVQNRNILLLRTTCSKSGFFVLVQKLFNVIILENLTELFLWLDAIVSTIVMTFRTNVDSHQKKQRFIVTISIVRMQ